MATTTEKKHDTTTTTAAEIDGGALLEELLAQAHADGKDTRSLEPADRKAVLVGLARKLGLNPMSNAVMFLLTNGRETLYVTKQGTDQIAAAARLQRETIKGPEVVTIEGRKLVFCQVRATHPDGRSEVSTATLALMDPVNDLMKCETKAKRRATLSVCGLGLLAEDEIETIPGAQRVPMSTTETAQATETAAPTGENAAAAVADVPAEPSGEHAEMLAAVHEQIANLELPGPAVKLWIAARPDLARCTATEREAVWKALCARTEEVGKMKNAKVWLKKAIAEEDARRSVGTEGALGPGDDDDPRPRGGRRTRAGHDAANAHGSEQASGDRASASGAQAMAASWEPTVTAEGVLIEDEAGARAHLAGLHPRALEHSYARHAGHAAWRALVVEYYRRRCGIVDARLARQRLDTASTNEPAEGRRAA